MTRSRISMVVAAAGLVLVGLLAFALFSPGTDQVEEQTATKDDEVKPMEPTQQPVKSALYDFGHANVPPPPPVMQVKTDQPPPPVTTTAKPERTEPKNVPEPAKKTGLIEYKIQPGDMVSKLAVKHGCTSNDIYRVNDGLNASNANKLRVGQTILIPVGGDGAVVSSTSAVNAEQADYFPRKVITAEAGDTVLQLALEHYGSMSYFRMILDANPEHDLRDGRALKGGEQVVLPEFGTPPIGLREATPASTSVQRGSLIPSRK